MEPLPFNGLELGSYVQIAGRKIWVTQVGEGPALLLLHGGGAGATGASNFSRNVPALARHFRLIIPDLPGYGRSTKGIDRADPFGDLAAAMLGLLDALGIEKVHALGNSLGGACALRLALERPERVDRLVLLGPGGIDTTQYPPTDGLKHLLGYYAGDGPTREKVATFLRNYLVFDGSAISDAVIDERFAASVDPETIANPPLQPPKDLSNALLLDLARDTRLRTLAAPTLVFWGMEDRTKRCAFVAAADAELRPLSVQPNGPLGAMGARGRIQRGDDRLSVAIRRCSELNSQALFD